MSLGSSSRTPMNLAKGIMTNLNKHIFVDERIAAYITKHADITA
jgi:hypothetical protein